MKKITGIAFLLMTVLLQTACDKCTTVDDAGNPERLLRVSENGQSAWFGADALYDPAAARFIHEREGELPFTVNEAENVVELTFPLTRNGEENIEIQLDSVTSVDLRYASLEFEQDCEKIYELSYIFVGDEQICSQCGGGSKVISVPVN